jgi:hypothetical protein
MTNIKKELPLAALFLYKVLFTGCYLAIFTALVSLITVILTWPG